MTTPGFAKGTSSKGIFTLLVIFFLLITSSCAPQTANLTQWYVSTDGNDHNNCRTQQRACRTILSAVNRARAGDTIFIADGWYYENLVITKEVMLHGYSMEQTVIDGGESGSVIYLDGTQTENGVNLTLINLTITRGSTERGGGININGGRSVKLQNVKIVGNLATDRGGGIFTNYASMVMLDNVQILDNRAEKEGGGIYFIGGPVGNPYLVMDILGSTISGNEARSGGGIYAYGFLNVTNSVIEGNYASTNGGGIFNIYETNIVNSKILNNSAYLSGGGICSQDDDMEGNRLFISDSTIDGNTAKIGGGITNRGNLSLVGSTISHNVARTKGGGIWNGGLGSGLMNRFYSMNSTISGNQAEYGGGIWSGEIGATGIFSGNMRLINLTIVENKGEGVYIHAGSISMRNILFAKNEGGNCDFVAQVSQKHNLSDDETCGAYIVADPLIGPLADNGGQTMTHALLPGSPAIDAAIDTVGMITDQRDYQRPRDGNWDGISDMDIGSFEADYPVEPK